MTPTAGWSVKQHCKNKETFKNMIAISNQPPIEDDNGVTPVSGCLKWTLQPDAADVVETAGSVATLVVDFPLPPTIPANGTEFTLWGHVFMIDDATPFTSESFEVTANPFETAFNFQSMLEANVFFRRATSIVLSGTFNNIATVSWRECREQPRFGGPSMDFAGLTATGATVTATNGVSPIYVTGYKLITRLLRTENTGVEYTEMTKLEGLEPSRTCSGSGPIAIDYMADAKRSLFPVLPELTATSYNAPSGVGVYTRTRNTGLLAVFQLEYGWIFRDDCNPRSGTIKKSPRVFVLNAAFPDEDLNNVRRYWADHPDGLPSGQFIIDFLTTQPAGTRVCRDTFCWLWFLNTYAVTASNFKVRFFVYDLAGAGSLHLFTMPHVGEIVQNFNCSPGFLAAQFGINLDNVSKYEVLVTGDDGLPSVFNATSSLTFVLDQKCCEQHLDAYFMTPAGGIGTLIAEKTEYEVNQDGTEICIDVPCGATGFEKSKKGGRTLTELRNYDSITIVARESFNEANQKWFADFKRSPHKWLRVEVPATEFATPQFVAKKFIVEPGGIRIFRNGENLELEAKGYLADIPTQSTTEQPFQI